jgi:heat shock protein HslJ
MNHLLLTFSLLFVLNAQKCNDRNTASGGPAVGTETGTRTDGGVTEKPVNKQDATAMAGQRWYILSMNGGELTVPEAGERPWIELNNGQLQGFGGCNNLMGSYTTENGSLHFAEVGSTKKYCPELQAVERSILDMLAEVNSFTVRENELLLQQGARELAVLRALE